MRIVCIFPDQCIFGQLHFVISVMVLVQALASIPRERAEWIIWIDMDVILGDIAFTFPLTKQQYVGKDFVVWGNVDAVHAGDTYNGRSCKAFMQAACGHISALNRRILQCLTLPSQ